VSVKVNGKRKIEKPYSLLSLDFPFHVHFHSSLLVPTFLPARNCN